MLHHLSGKVRQEQVQVNNTIFSEGDRRLGVKEKDQEMHISFRSN